MWPTELVVSVKVVPAASFLLGWVGPFTGLDVVGRRCPGDCLPAHTSRPHRSARLSTWSCCCPPLPKPTLMSTTFLRIKPSPRLLGSYSEAHFHAQKFFFYVKAFTWFFSINFPFQNKDTVKLSSLPHPRKLLQILQIFLILEGLLRTFYLHDI